MKVDNFLAENCCVVVFCGGPAKRLQPVLKGTPKALVKLHKRPYLDSLLRSISKSGFRDVVLCISPITMQIASEIGSGVDYNLNIQYSLHPEMKENAHRLWVAMPRLHHPLLLCINGDTVVDVNFQRLIYAHVGKSPVGTLVASTREDQPHTGAVEVSLDGWVKDIHEADQDAGKKIIGATTSRWLSNSGVYVFSRVRLCQDWPLELRVGKIEEGLLRHLARKNLVWAYDNGDNYLLDLGVPERLQKALKELNDISDFFPL